MSKLFLLVAVLISSASANNDQGSVIQKVIEMLSENKVKIADDLAKEETEQAAYSQYCDDEAGAREYAIKTATRTINDLEAEILDCKAQTAAADDEIATLGTEMAGKDSDLGAAASQRSKEKADFEVVEKQLVTSVDQLEKAVVLMKRGASAFLQSGVHPKNWKEMQARALNKLLGKVIDAAWVDKVQNVKVLKGFLQEQENAGDSDELKLHANTEASEGILEALEEMKEKAEETLSGARMTEMKGNHNYQMLVQSLTDARSLAAQKSSEATSLKASLSEASGKAKAEMALTQKTKMADMTFLSTLKQECETAAKEWAEKQASAKAEMAAIEKAKSILSDRVKVFLNGFVQTASADPWDDSSADDDKKAAVRSRLVAELKTLSHSTGSYAMMELASSASQDPFEKVKGLISDMIAKLVSEANAEATQKAFCDEETAKSKKEQAEKSMRSDELTSRIDGATAKKDELLQLIKDLNAEIAEDDAATAKATEIRAEEKATYLKASADFKGAAQAVEDAIRVLKEYYEGASFVQVGSKQPKSDAAATIVGILETSGAEFTKMYMEVETSETEAVAAFKKMTDEGKVTKASKAASVTGAESEIKSLDVALANSGEDLKMVTKELDAVMSYIDKLKPQCEAKAMTYEEKVAKRNAEIEGLKEALSILESPALLQTAKGLRGTKRH